jgi:LPXTG-motif cell wall-anchored protein
MTQSNGNRVELSGGSIGGIVVGLIGALAVAIGALFFFKRRRRNRRRWQDGPSYREKGGSRSAQRNLYSPSTERGEFDHNPETLGVGNASSQTDRLGEYGGVGTQEPMSTRGGRATTARSDSSRSSRSNVPRPLGATENPFAG